MCIEIYMLTLDGIAGGVLMVLREVEYFLVSEHLGLDIAGADIMPGYCSDHSLVYIGFKSDIVKRHRPLWKFSNSLLRDRVFVNLVKQVFLWI